MLLPPAIVRVIRLTRRPSSLCRLSAARSSAGSLPSICIGHGSSCFTCRSAGSLFSSQIMCCSGCRAPNAGPGSTHLGPCAWGGAVLMVGAAVALMLALTWGGRRYAWASPQILLLLLVSIALWGAFAWRVMTAEEPFIPLAVLRDGATRVGTAAAFFAVGLVIALTIILPLYAQLALGLSVSESGSAIIALQGAATLTSMIGGRLLVRFTHYKRVPLVGLLLSMTALVPLAIAPTELAPSAALGLIALVGLGLGPMFPFTVVLVQNA